MYFVSSERLAVLIDGANLQTTARALDLDVDYRRLLALFRGKAHLVRALYYTTIVEDDEFSSIRPLIDWLAYNGFTVVTKSVKTFIDGDGRRHTKASMGVELTVDALVLAPRLDHLVLVTGDGDYTPLVAALQQAGKRVTVISTLATQPSMVADELRRRADQFIDLGALAEYIARSPDTPRTPARNAQAADPISSAKSRGRRMRATALPTAHVTPQNTPSSPTTTS